MGRKLNLSTPTVIQSELIPLNESFYIENSGTLEQWFYDNTSTYAPNRKITPLILTPRISVSDGDTGRSYTPQFYSVSWYVNQYNPSTGEYEETEITNINPSTAGDFYKDANNNLIVRKNVSYTHAITIRCAAQYIDPRDAGVTYNIGGNLTLITNRDASVVFPKVDILAPSAQSFNPLIDSVSEFEMKAIADWTGIASDDVILYKADANGTEEVVPQNTTDIINCAPYLDIRYADDLLTNQEFLFRPTAGGIYEQIDGDMARLERVGGKTVGWNQWAQSTGFKATEQASLLLEDNIVTASTSTRFKGCLCNVFAKANEKLFVRINVLSVDAGFCAAMATNNGQWESNVVTLQAGINTFILTTGRNVSRFIINTKNTPSSTVSVSFKDCMVINLTAIFGAGNEPETVEEFEAWLAANIGLRDYYPYSEGNFANVKMTGLKTTGFNQWDEEWEVGGLDNDTGATIKQTDRIRSKNFIPCIPSTNYFGRITSDPSVRSLYVYFYDASKNYISYSSGQGNQVITSPSNAYYMKFRTYSDYGTTYNNDICINLSDPQKNGTYEPYWSETMQVPVTTIRGKENGTGTPTAMFSQGMNGIGDVSDEIGTTELERNVPTAAPKIGDAVFYDDSLTEEDRTAIIIDQDTLYPAEIPATWVYIGEVIDTVGEDKVKILDKNFSTAKYLDVCQYSITAISSTSLVINLRMSPDYSVDTTVNVTLTSAAINATSAQEISNAVAAKAAAVGDTKAWWAYLADANGNKVTSGGTKIIIQCDTCVDYRFYNVSATGCTISHTTWGDMPADSNSGQRASGLTSDQKIMNVRRAAIYYSTNGVTPSANVALNAAGTIVTKAAFLTSTYCETLRNTYHTYENYIEQEYKLVYPQSGGVWNLPDGKTLTETYGDMTAPTKSGSTKYKFPALRYARTIGYSVPNLGTNKWYLHGVQEGAVMMDDKGMSIINNTRKKMSRTLLSNNSNRWFAQRYNTSNAWFFNGNYGTLNISNVNYTYQVGAVSLYTYK